MNMELKTLVYHLENLGESLMSKMNQAGDRNKDSKIKQRI